MYPRCKEPVDQWAFTRGCVKDHEIIGIELEWHRGSQIGCGIIYDWYIDNVKISNFKFDRVSLFENNTWVNLEGEIRDKHAMFEFDLNHFAMGMDKGNIVCTRSPHDFFILYTNSRAL